MKFVRRSLCSFVAVALLGTLQFAAAIPATGQSADPVVRLAFGTSNYSGLPIFLAIDRHLFEHEHINVVPTTFIGSATVQLPRMVRGDVDIIASSPGPGVFNQQLQGFEMKFIASEVQTRNGWNDTTWFVVRQDLWDAKAIQRPSDAKGHTLDGAVQGAPPDYMARTFVAQNDLGASVKVSDKFRVPSDWYSAFRNKAIDIQGLTEPAATELEQQGLGHKWIPIHAVLPGYQEVYFVVSAAFLRDHREAVRRFLIGYLKGAAIVNASGGKWTPALISTAAKWTTLPEATLRKVPGPPYFGDFGDVNITALQRVVDFYVEQGLVPHSVPAANMVDTSILFEARRAASRERSASKP
jgi:ABC-type nitrate/sulfonate/bicarbonate transport system substrate-binding protein